jgi:hypothetical protein
MSLRELFRPKWKHSNPGVRAAAVAKLTNQALLGQIATPSATGRTTVPK